MKKQMDASSYTTSRVTTPAVSCQAVSRQSGIDRQGLAMGSDDRDDQETRSADEHGRLVDRGDHGDIAVLARERPKPCGQPSSGNLYHGDYAFCYLHLRAPLI